MLKKIIDWFRYNHMYFGCYCKIGYYTTQLTLIPTITITWGDLPRGAELSWLSFSFWLHEYSDEHLI